ncbi:MAG TPA: M81 family metallopeptidase, partial [Chloroflexota bacterium]
MRLALLGFHHETNTFATRPTSYDDFAQHSILRDEELVQRHAEAHSTIAGFLEAGRRLDATVVPLYYATANPSGMISRDTFEGIAAALLRALDAGGPWDGVLLALHGAAVAEGYLDADGEVVARIRADVGARVPIGLALDLHANVTAQMVDNATVTVLYRTNPHLDPRQRAFECGEFVVRTVRGEIHPVQALETPPLVINIVTQGTEEEPLRSLMAAADAVIARPGMLTASVAVGYPYADVPEMGAAFLAVHDGDPSAARAAAQELAALAWQRRAAFVGRIPGAGEA